MIPLLPSTGSVDTSGAVIWVVFAGLLGAFVRQLLEGGGLKLPSVKENTLYLGFIGELIVGAVAGYFLGDSAVGAFSIGLTAAALVNGLITKPLLTDDDVEEADTQLKADKLKAKRK